MSALIQIEDTLYETLPISDHVPYDSLEILFISQNPSSVFVVYCVGKTLRCNLLVNENTSIALLLLEDLRKGSSIFLPERWASGDISLPVISDNIDLLKTYVKYVCGMEES